MNPLPANLAALHLTTEQVNTIVQAVDEACSEETCESRWQHLLPFLRKTPLPFAVHELLYKFIYPDWETLPAPAWFPDASSMPTTHLYTLMREKNCADYAALHHYSVTNRRDFWQAMVEKLAIHFDQPYTELLDLSTGIETPTWFRDAKMNISNSCFQAKPEAIAIISQTEQGDVTRLTYAELDHLSNRIANSFAKQVSPGDKVAIIMPMTTAAVAIYLAIIKAGCVAVAIPDSFVADEMATRLQIANVKLVFCQDDILRDGKALPLYSRVIAAHAPSCIVIAAAQQLTVTLRKQDVAWDDFLLTKTSYTPHTVDPQHHLHILFSSGTTGAPKAIPWTHTAPIKCASDAYLHHNLHAQAIFCWPTNLGWMMGPWLIFACLINRATLALYEGTPNGQAFGEFLAAEHITHLGVVPTMVKTWRSSACMQGLDFSHIQLFTSTGERSNIEDMLYLMYLANYRPIIEYCGGTEIAGAYLTGSLLQPAAPGAFSTAAAGLDFVILDEAGKVADKGEVALLPPSLGLSTELINKNHHDVYYAAMPTINGTLLRRHGDEVQRFANGYYRLLGRVDDTMKLSGIKISSAEIETVLNTIATVDETAAIAVNLPDGGPSQLVIYAVLQNEATIPLSQLKTEMQQAIKQHLNPLFKLHDVIIINALPRTASNKIVRRSLRDDYGKRQIN